MHRSKRLLILVGVLAVVCAAAFLATRVQEQQEQVEASGETVLAIDAGNVASLAWTSGEAEYAFHKDGTWIYDADEAFPVSAEALEELLAPFSSFNAAFVIRDVTDYAQYGLEEPECTIEIGTADASYTIALGDMSAMDDQRYVSIGDDNVYLAVTDPMDAFAVELSDLIDNDEIPQMDTVTALSLTGAVEESIAYVEAGGPSYSDEDVYFLQSGEESLPLDTDLVEDYLGGIRSLVLTDYATYNATEIELASFGLNDPGPHRDRGVRAAGRSGGGGRGARDHRRSPRAAHRPRGGGGGVRRGDGRERGGHFPGGSAVRILPPRGRFPDRLQPLRRGRRGAVCRFL